MKNKGYFSLYFYILYVEITISSVVYFVYINLQKDTTVNANKNINPYWNLIFDCFIISSP